MPATSQRLYPHPEPVPYASQLAVLPFLAGVYGLLTAEHSVRDLRVTMHRTMNRDGEQYLQQLCAYIKGNVFDWRKGAGRLFPVDEGLIGAAFENPQVWRTKGGYETLEECQRDLRSAMDLVGDGRSIDEVALSYLAIPFLGPEEQVVLILYADCNELNFFADDVRISRVVGMCRGLAALLDSLESSPFPNLQNFELLPGTKVTAGRTAYLIQEAITSPPPPAFRKVRSFNYEASVS